MFLEQINTESKRTVSWSRASLARGRLRRQLPRRRRRRRLWRRHAPAGTHRASTCESRARPSGLTWADPTRQHIPFNTSCLNTYPPTPQHNPLNTYPPTTPPLPPLPQNSSPTQSIQHASHDLKSSTIITYVILSTNELEIIQLT